MIIIGDEFVPFEDIVTITCVDDINNTKANSTLIFEFEQNLLSYCNENSLNGAVYVSSLKDAIYANALNARYIIAQKDLATKIQKTAENYMFDAKVLAVITNNSEFEEIATLEIDGVIYNSLLKDLSK